MQNPFYTMRQIWRYEDGALSESIDPVVIEEQAVIILDGQELVRMACSPDSLVELAAGYLISEGIIAARANLKGIEVRNDREILVSTFQREGRNEGLINTVVVNTCMGRGTASPEQVPARIGRQVIFNAERLISIIAELDSRSDTFRVTGGVHSAGLGSDAGLEVRFEDIGRHNAVDKCFGYALLNDVDLLDKCLALSGRIAGEILLKAARAGVSIVLSRSAPTLKTVELAERLGICIVGFARGRRFNVYTFPDRIQV